MPNNQVEVIVKYNGELQGLAQDLGAEVAVLSNNYAVLTLDPSLVSGLSQLPQIEYVEQAKRLAMQQSSASMEASCITPVQPGSAYNLSGEGVIVAVIDSGIDYTHPAFIDDEGYSRILYIWDQNLEGSPPRGFAMGSEFSREQINAALAEADPVRRRALLPHVDFNGHGTAVAGVAAGGGLTQQGRYLGAAPGASLIVVKLRANQSPYYTSTTDLMRGIKYVVDAATALNMPVVINLSFGTNDGSHDGHTLFEQYLDDMADHWLTSIVVATGNEGLEGHHFSGQIGVGQTQDVEFSTQPGLTYLSVIMRKSFVDVFSYEIIASTGQSSGRITRFTGGNRVVLGNVAISLELNQPTPYDNDQNVRFTFSALGEGTIPASIWTIRIRGLDVVVGTFDLWLPVTEISGSGTTFLNPTLDTTLTIPSTASKVISVGGYDSSTGTFAQFSGRGYVNSERDVKPDLTAPAVDVWAPRPSGGYGVFTGTSFAAPHVTGSCALLMQWGIVQHNDPFLYGQRLKGYLRLGAIKSSGVEYPNNRWGFGTLCLRATLDQLMRYAATASLAAAAAGDGPAAVPVIGPLDDQLLVGFGPQVELPQGEDGVVSIPDIIQGDPDEEEFGETAIGDIAVVAVQGPPPALPGWDFTEQITAPEAPGTTANSFDTAGAPVPLRARGAGDMALAAEPPPAPSPVPSPAAIPPALQPQAATAPTAPTGAVPAPGAPEGGPATGAAAADDPPPPPDDPPADAPPPAPSAPTGPTGPNQPPTGGPGAPAGNAPPPTGLTAPPSPTPAGSGPPADSATPRLWDEAPGGQFPANGIHPVVSEDYYDYLISYNGSIENVTGRYPGTYVSSVLEGDFAIAHVPVSELSGYKVGTREQIANEMAVICGLSDETSLNISGITEVQNLPYTDLKGRGVIFGIVDTGLDYTLPDFIYEDGTSKVLSIWDQSITGAGGMGMPYGTEYTQTQINQALASDAPFSVVPSNDDIGHGTFMSSLAAGRPSGTSTGGAAPDADLVVVKLKPAKEAMLEYRAIYTDAPAYESSDIVAGVEYIYRKSQALGRPAVIFLGVQSNDGAHDGLSIFERYLGRLSLVTGLVLITGVGNEGNRAHHTTGRVENTETPYEIEMNVAREERGFLLSIWAFAPNRISVALSTPLGEVVERSPFATHENNQVSFVLSQTRIGIHYDFPSTVNGSQLINITFRDPTPGLWRIRVYGDLILDGVFQAWLPISQFLQPDTIFLNSSTSNTVTIPSSGYGIITAGAYNGADRSMYTSSGRGPSLSGKQCPDLVAPGVNVGGLLPGGQEGIMTGTSVAAALTAGAAALILQWGVVLQNDQAINTQKMRAYLIMGCTQSTGIVYPDPLRGYGELNLINSFRRIRRID